MTGFTFVDKMRDCLLAFNIKVQSSSMFTFNVSRSYKLLYSVYARKPSQIHERNLRIIYVAVCKYLCIYLSVRVDKFFSLGQALGWKLSTTPFSL